MGWHLALTFLAGSGLAWLSFRRAALAAGRRQGIGLLAAMMGVTVLILSTEGYGALRDSVLGPYQQLAALARPDAQAGIPVLYFNIIPRRPSMNFYAGYAPFEHQEIPLLPFLARCMPPSAREADLVLTRDAYVRLLMPEIMALPGASARQIQQRGPNGEWLLMRLTLPPGYKPPDNIPNIPPPK